MVERRPQRWALVGHSLGGKIAAIVTARAEAGVPTLTTPRALVLVAASPPGVEPMDEATRAEMIGWCADGSVSDVDARSYVDANTAGQLPTELLAAAVADVQAVSRTAWLAWLERGSLEDWTDAVGTLGTPALVVAGAEDGDLGADAQRRLTMPHTTAPDVTTVADAAHLIPLEQPARLARLIADHLHAALAGDGALPASFEELIHSDRVSARTRSIMLGRLPEPPDTPRALDGGQRSLLTALLARVLPQRGTTIDLAARIDARLGSGAGDGWRFAELPADPEAWRRGLDTLADAAGSFEHMSDSDQDGWIERLIAGEVGSEGRGHLTAEQMTLWFEDVRAEAVRTWLAHPAALARIGYDGFANGGDGLRKQGFLRLGAGERETWQPELPKAQS